MSAARVAVIDSGVDPGHPLVRGRGVLHDGGSLLAGGRAADGGLQDRLGHGTAVAAVLLAAVPTAELVSVRIFDEAPAVDFGTVLAALEHALTFAPAVVNLSLGTTSLRHRAALQELVTAAAGAGAVLVAPASYGGLPCDPGALPGVEAVASDPNLLPHCPELRPHGGRLVWFASPLPPRDLDGGRRLLARGESLACARVSAALLQRRT